MLSLPSALFWRCRAGGLGAAEGFEAVGSAAHRDAFRAMRRAGLTRVGTAPRPELGENPLFLGCHPFRTTQASSPVDTKVAFGPWMAQRLGGEALVTPTDPEEGDIARAVDAARGHSALVLGTYNAHVKRGQLRLLAALAGLGLPMIDFSAALTAHADEPIFYRTDHHWTSLGAFYGANALLEVLGRESLKQESFTPEIASTSFNGTLYSQSGIHWLTPDTMEFWVKEDGLTVTSWRTGSPEPGILYDRSYLTEKDKYASFLGGNQPLCVIWNENARDGGKLLLIRDSYSDALAPFLAQSFAEVHLLDPRYYRMPPAQYAAENGIDAICVVYSIPNFITDRNLVFLAQ